MTAAPAGGGLAEVLGLLAAARNTPHPMSVAAEIQFDFAAGDYLRERGEAIGELIEADKEYDAAREGYSDRTATPEQIDRLARAELRRRAALAKVASNGDTK